MAAAKSELPAETAAEQAPPLEGAQQPDQAVPTQAAPPAEQPPIVEPAPYQPRSEAASTRLCRVISPMEHDLKRYEVGDEVPLNFVQAKPLFGRCIAKPDDIDDGT